MGFDLKGKTNAEKVKEITEKLEEGVKGIFESGKYEKYLKTVSKFHKYSANNSLLILFQKPDASLVAGYKKWQKDFKRNVKPENYGSRSRKHRVYGMQSLQYRYL